MPYSENYRMASPTSGVPPSQDHQFSMDLFSVSGAKPGPLTPNLLGVPASPLSYHSNNSTPRSTGPLSLGMESHSLQPNSYNENMLTPHRAGYGNSSYRTNEFPSEKTTPSFNPEDLPEDLEMSSWVEGENLSLFPPLGASVTSPTAAATIRQTSPVMATTVPEHHHKRTIPTAPPQADGILPVKKLDEPIITQIRRTGTDESTASWMISPIVRVEDTENSEVNLALSADSSSTDTGNVGEIGPTGTLISSSLLQVERRPRSQSMREIERDEDGVWSGLSPEMRRGLKSSALGLGINPWVEYLPMNLREMEQFKKIHEKNLEVEAWLNPVLDSRVKMSCQGLTVPRKDKRSKSISDFRFEPSGCESRPGFIGDIDMAEDTDSDEDVSAKDSSWEEGSLDAWGECAEKSNKNTTNSSPPANPEEVMSMEPEPEEYDPNTDPKLLPLPGQFFSAMPWHDDPTFGPNSSQINQPSTSNHAISKFKECADNLETISRVATFGSGTMRGLGLEDVFLNREGILKRLSFGRDKDKDKDRDKERSPKERRSSIFELPFELPFKGHKRTPTNSTQGGLPKSILGEKSQQDTPTHATFSPPKRKSSWNQRKSKLSIDTAIGQMTGQLAAIGAADGSKSATSGGSPIPWSPFALNSLNPPPQLTRRSRTKSDLSNIGSTLSAKLTKLRPTTKADLDLVTLMQRHGGPPTIPIMSNSVRRHTLGSTTSIPSIVTGAAANKIQREKQVQGEVDNSDDDDDDDGDLVMVPHKLIRKLDIKPTLEGFAAHISELNPRLERRLVDRIAQEQVKRYKKLEDYKAKHFASLRGDGYPNKNRCSALNPQATAFSITSDEISGKDRVEEHLDSTILGAQYPFGIPDPPATHLPAEFECTICFKVKKFSKPSDWTKHVHEDVQPFTCTFPDCTEPKSFKRKADWVRHENEKHRHLEWWKCNQPDCHHVCYRKDNFVQHLVREHKFQEPKVKAVRAAMKAKVEAAGMKGKKEPFATGGAVDPVKEQTDKVLAIVELCHNVTSKDPSSEKCRFCGAACSTWKKLTVHLARHMEYISLPILGLLDDCKSLIPSPESFVPAAAAAKINTPILTSVARDEITSQLNTDGDHFCAQHKVGIPAGPPENTNTTNMFLPTAPSGEIRSHASHMPMLSSSPPTNLTLPYLDPNPFQDQCCMDNQQQEGGTGGSGAVEFYPTPSGSVSPYLLPSQHSPYLLGQQYLSGTTTPIGGGLLNAPEAQRFTVPTPGTTPPRSRHGLPHSQQSQLGGASPNLDFLNPMSCYPHTHSLITSTAGVNMSMLNMSLPATSVSMEQLTFTSGPACTNVTGMTMDMSMGMTMEMGSLEQLSIQDLERRLLHANANAARSNAPLGAGAGVDADVYAPHSVRPH